MGANILTKDEFIKICKENGGELSDNETLLECDMYSPNRDGYASLTYDTRINKISEVFVNLDIELPSNTTGKLNTKPSKIYISLDNGFANTKIRSGNIDITDNNDNTYVNFSIGRDFK